MAAQHDDTTPYAPGIRLCMPDDLGPGASVQAGPAEAHYLCHVMRCKVGDEIALFNGRDGEWRARIDGCSKKAVTLVCVALIREQTRPADIWLLFAPVKRARLDFIVEKATELGVGVLCPVFTRFTQADRVRVERMASTAREAAEQCGRLEVPDVADPRKLADVLDGWNPARLLFFCDEGGDVPAMATALDAAARGP
ncbi:MAG: RsmE family RNA methyltransferase, partial [Sphingomonadales bacterium]